MPVFFDGRLRFGFCSVIRPSWKPAHRTVFQRFRVHTPEHSCVDKRLSQSLYGRTDANGSMIFRKCVPGTASPARTPLIPPQVQA